MIIMKLFVYLAEFPFVICKSYKIAYVANEILIHLKKQYAAISTSQRYAIVQTIDTIPEIIRDQSKLRYFQFPPPIIDSILFIAPPKNDGL